VSLRLREHPVPVIGLMSALCADQSSFPHRFPTDYPLRRVMAAAHRFDKSGRSLSEYEALTAFVEKWARKQMRPNAICDECGRSMGWEVPAADDFADLDYLHVFSLGRTLNSYFLCSLHAETWRAEGDAGLSRITGLTTRYNHAERSEREGKAKLPALPPSGGLFAGIILPGGSEPTTVPLRAGDGALPNVSRILNTFRFDLRTEAA
jgi:hypothetical protein